jgi:hypothetical protein
VSFWTKRLGPRLWPLYVFGGALLWWADPSPGSLIAGGALAAAGEGLRLWATGHLNKNEALTVTGPYGFLRHPLYLGSFVLVTGFAIMARTTMCLVLYGLFVAFFFGYYMPYKTRIEGARLERLYGDAFRRYELAVPSLIPRLHGYRPLGPERSDEVAWRGERFVDNHEVGTAAGVSIALLAMIVRWAIA